MNTTLPSSLSKDSVMPLPSRLIKPLVKTLSLLSVCCLIGAIPARAAEEARAVWSSRFEYSSEADIRLNIIAAHSSGCNTMLFQVRGQGDAFYISELEPWSDLLGGAYPGFDPLAVAIEEARLRDMELHAYVNAFPMWSGSMPHSDPQHIYNAHPEWVMVDQSGATMDPAEGYAFLSPGIPEAAQHVQDVIGDIVANYDVDGVHLDYIRYPNSGYSYDDSSQARFLREYGGTPQELPDQWKKFRRDLVTQFVSGVYQTVTELKPWVKVSAAVWGAFYDGYTFYYQDSHGWLEQGILDFSAPMIYTGNISDFQSRLQNHTVNSYGRHIYGGIGIYLPSLDAPTMIEEIDICRDEGAQGQVLFSVSDLSNGFQSALAGGPYSSEAGIPAMSWKEPRPFALSIARSTGENGVNVLFNQPVQQATAEDEANYSFAGELSLATGESAQLDDLNPALVHLTTTSQMEGALYTLTASDVQDLGGHVIAPPNASRKFVGQRPSGDGIVVDNSDPGFSTVGTWISGSYGTPYGSDYVWTSFGSGASATWIPDLPGAGTFEVYAYWVAGTNRAPDAPYIVHHAGGTDTFRVDQRQNGERWNRLGSFSFDAGSGSRITLTSQASSGVVIADAIKLVETSTAVPMAHLAAREREDAVLLTWTLDPEMAAVGCHIYRHTSADGPFQRLNAWLLLEDAQGQYVDDAVHRGTLYFYTLGVVDEGGRETLYGPVTIALMGPVLPEQPILDPNYPNPFNASTYIRFNIPPGTGPLPISLKIYNILGQEVRTLLDETKNPGRYTVLWDGRNGTGEEAASGVYFCRLQVGQLWHSRKMTLIR
jgi:uncharacterized lipoprotein YddW (UPF0748 family)